MNLDFAQIIKPIAAFVLAILLLHSTATAQTVSERQCADAVQNKVAYDQAGNKAWSPDNIGKLCQGTTNPSATISCFQEQIRQHNDWSRGIAACQPKLGPEVVRASFDSNPYVFDSTVTSENKWRWNGGAPFIRTIYNPLDGGVLLKYKQEHSQNNADGCSGPTPEDWKKFFQQACFAHDTNYDAPWGLAGFPSYAADGTSTGKELADYLFLKDMLLIGKQNISDPLQRNIAETAAYSWFRAVQDFGGYRGKSEGKSILEKGGAIAVKNNGAYTTGLRVKWIDPKGAPRVEEVMNAGGRAATIPLSVGARNIEVEGWAVGGKTIFKKALPAVGMYAYTVGGATLTPTLDDGLKADLGNAIAKAVTGEPVREGQRAIKFNNQAGYVAEMVVMYFANQNIGGTMIPMPQTLVTPKISLGFTRPLIIPPDIAQSQPITVIIRGIGTVKGDVFSTTVPASFTGELCFKAWGTIFDAQGGKCS